MTTFDLILAYPLTALVVFALAVGFMWLFLLLGWFFLSGLWVTTWEYRWHYYLRPRVARWWQELSKLWGGESAWPTGNPWDSDRVGHRRVHDSLRPFNFNGRRAVPKKAVSPCLPRASDDVPPQQPRAALHFPDLRSLINKR
ncbi:hypothetical protein LCGC14_0673530 [marine sediment metagenome]|uniref:Uncharacterized protein n=1 Tax=marine sediment metagenome TaxID=412755 RepID=A0A0F9RAM4_9ZZZZ